MKVQKPQIFKKKVVRQIIFKPNVIQLCPSEVESILRSHPGIEDCAVVGRQEQMVGSETPAAFVVKSAKYQQLAPNEIRQYVGGT